MRNSKTRRPVKVQVSIVAPRPTPSDLNNNLTRLLVHPPSSVPKEAAPMTGSSLILDLPPVSAGFVIFQVLIYIFREYAYVYSEEDIYISWKTVVTDGEVWRLLYAQFFHFTRVHMFFSAVALMTIGRYMEKKITKIGLSMLIMLMSVVSNILYLLFNNVLCPGPHPDYTFGFSNVMFSLRMIHVFTMDHDANNGKGEPNLVFGFLPVYMPPFLAPWQPLLETIFFEVGIMGRCIAANISGMCAGLLFPYLVKKYRNFIMLPRNPPPPPPQVRSRHSITADKSD